MNFSVALNQFTFSKKPLECQQKRKILKNTHHNHNSSATHETKQIVATNTPDCNNKPITDTRHADNNRQVLTHCQALSLSRSQPNPASVIYRRPTLADLADESASQRLLLVNGGGNFLEGRLCRVRVLSTGFGLCPRWWHSVDHIFLPSFPSSFRIPVLLYFFFSVLSTLSGVICDWTFTSGGIETYPRLLFGGGGEWKEL